VARAATAMRGATRRRARRGGVLGVRGWVATWRFLVRFGWPKEIECLSNDGAMPKALHPTLAAPQA
jgi:hypothetical protein